MTSTGDRIRGAAFDAFVLIFQAALVALGLCVVWYSAAQTIVIFGSERPAHEVALGASLMLVGMLVGIAIAGWSLSNMLSYVGTVRLRSKHEAEERRRAAPTGGGPAR